MQSKQDYSITALDLFVSTGLDNTYEVDLSSKVFTEQGAGFQVTEVDVLSKTNNCQIQSITKSGFIVQASEAKVCDYRYYVQATHSIDSKATYANEVSTS
ncbi:Ig-like domain-containing protein, partial [Vibrio genomosp. F10 str. 9ZD137]